ncbi:MAG: hypothetical protein QOJ26_862, partial [Thermoplasmata archaeon]|nr:hypothetical protein [Thermoplasmata archaeon]
MNGDPVAAVVPKAPAQTRPPSTPAEPDWIGLYLQEDLGAGDITTDPLFPPTHKGAARMVARERALMAGGAHAVEVFRRLGATATPIVKDGAWADAGQAV